MPYTNDEKWALLHQIDQLDTNYFGLINEHRHIEASRAAEGNNLIEQTVAYNTTVACTFLNLLDRRDDSIRCNNQFAYHHVDEAANLLRSIYPQLPADHVPVSDHLRCPEPSARPPARPTPVLIPRRHDQPLPARHAVLQSPGRTARARPNAGIPFDPQLAG